MVALLVMAAPHKQWSPLEYLQQPALFEAAWAFLAPYMAEFEERRSALEAARDG